jgi:hypothetical protein
MPDAYDKTYSGYFTRGQSFCREAGGLPAAPIFIPRISARPPSHRLMDFPQSDALLQRRAHTCGNAA